MQRSPTLINLKLWQSSRQGLNTHKTTASGRLAAALSSITATACWVWVWSGFVRKQAKRTRTEGAVCQISQGVIIASSRADFATAASRLPSASES